MENNIGLFIRNGHNRLLIKIKLSFYVIILILLSFAHFCGLCLKMRNTSSLGSLILRSCLISHYMVLFSLGYELIMVKIYHCFLMSFYEFIISLMILGYYELFLTQEEHLATLTHPSYLFRIVISEFNLGIQPGQEL